MVLECRPVSPDAPRWAEAQEPGRFGSASPLQRLERMGGIPLRPDPLAWREMQRRSFTRACAAMAMTTTRGRTSQGPRAGEVLRTNWPDDDKAR
jgi:hypothetical protein